MVHCVQPPRDTHIEVRVASLERAIGVPIRWERQTMAREHVGTGVAATALQKEACTSVNCRLRSIIQLSSGAVLQVQEMSKQHKMTKKHLK